MFAPRDKPKAGVNESSFDVNKMTFESTSVPLNLDSRTFNFFFSTAGC